MRLIRRVQGLTGVRLTKEAMGELVVFILFIYLFIYFFHILFLCFFFSFIDLAIFFLIILIIFLLEITKIKNCSSRYTKSKCESKTYEYYFYRRGYSFIDTSKKRPPGNLYADKYLWM